MTNPQVECIVGAILIVSMNDALGCVAVILFLVAWLS